MGNCSSAKKPVRADVAKAAQSTQALAKSENLNPNLPNAAAGAQKPIAEAQQSINNLVNGISKIKNFKIKFVNLDDSYYPNKKPAAEAAAESPLKSAVGSDTALVPKHYPAETLLRDCVLGVINEPSRRNFRHFNVARYNKIDLEDKMGFRLEELMKEGDETTEHLVNLVYTGLRNFPLNAREYIEKNTNFYATVNYNSENNRELVVFAKDVLSPNYIKIHKVYDDIFDAETNEIINEHTTICNGLNYFYVSGAGIKGLSKSFMRIKLDAGSQSGLPAAKLIQPLADMPEELQLHVMIYVPDNYIFVVGGHSESQLASNKVYFYDIKNNSWDKHSELKNGRVEHSLCLVNDEYLYAFFGHKNNKGNDEKTIERISLRCAPEPLKTWEQINVETFDLSFFTLYAVGQYKNAILLLNVDENKDTAELEDNNQRNLIFSLETNKLSLYSSENIKLLKGNKPLLPLGHSSSLLKDNNNNDDKKFESYKLDFFERAFVPIAENIMVLSPYNHNKEKTNLVIIKDCVALNEPFSHV